jgi:hypothetical protein
MEEKWRTRADDEGPVHRAVGPCGNVVMLRSENLIIREWRLLFGGQKERLRGPAASPGRNLRRDGGFGRRRLKMRLMRYLPRFQRAYQ